MFFRWFVSNGLWNVIPKETSNSAEAKSPKLAYGNCMFCSRKNLALPIEKIPYLVLPRNAIILQSPYYPISTLTIICQVVTYRRLKTKKRLAVNAVAVT